MDGRVTDSPKNWIGDIRPGEIIAIGENITLQIEHKSGQRARIRLILKEPTTVKKIVPEPEMATC